MGLSNYAVEQMGFRRADPKEAPSAEFHSLHTFEAAGLALEKDTLIEAQGAIGGVSYHVALGTSVNAAARRLIADDLTDDEERWLVENKCTPPFLMLHVGPTAHHTMTGAYVKFEEGRVTTYEGFLPARAELKELESGILPNVLSALTCEFSRFHDSVKFKRVARDVFGKTPDGKTLYDFGIEIRGSMTVARAITASDATQYLARTTTLAASMSPKISRFFHLALEEEDPLKRFLYFFLTIERQTHAAFASVDHRGHIASLTNGPDRVRASMADFLVAQSERWKALQERFIWCALSVWTQLTDVDVDSFKEVKRVRDQLAHGEIATPPAHSVIAVEQLAKKLQLGPNTSA
ncbi:MAG TPA: hypothetical protein VMV97_01130 [Sulfuriferula sp.]|nr:hypothetical protein [Sulfuriferula sp.]